MTRAATGIVLAGGRSTRFGADKLAATLDGRSLLAHAVAAIDAVAAEVIVVVGADGPAPVLAAPIRVVADPHPDGGPLVALVAGLESASHPFALVAGGDMPTLEPGVLLLLLDEVESGAAAALLEGGNRRQSLPCALRTGDAIAAGRALLAAGRSSLRELLDRLDVVVIPEAAWRPLDPGGRTLVDVDQPADLARLTRGWPERQL